MSLVKKRDEILSKDNLKTHLILERMSESAEFPWQHSFPPFYTLQPNLDSRKKQLEAWRSIVLDYCQKRGLTSLDLREASNSELFNNTAIQRRLSDEALQGTEY